MNYALLYQTCAHIKVCLEMMVQCEHGSAPRAKLEQEIAVLLESLKPILE